MKELDPMVFFFVFQEMLGYSLWFYIVIFLLTIYGFIRLWRLEHKFNARRMVLAEIAGLFGGVFALIIMATVSSSGFTDAGGPADWFLIAMVYGFGFVAVTLMFYTALGLWQNRNQTLLANN